VDKPVRYHSPEWLVTNRGARNRFIIMSPEMIALGSRVQQIKPSARRVESHPHMAPDSATVHEAFPQHPPNDNNNNTTFG